MWVPWAVRKPINIDPGDGPRVGQLRALILHTAVTRAESLYPVWKDGGLETPFYLRLDGTLEQYLDSRLQGDHAWDANSWALGLESQDTGKSSDPGPWTQAQLDTIDRLCRVLGIPAKPLDCVPSEGIGYHRQCSAWNQSNHSCPGNAKVRQIPGIIARLKEDDMTPEQAKQLDTIYGRVYAIYAGDHPGKIPIDTLADAIAEAVVAKLPDNPGIPSAQEIALAVREEFRLHPLD